MPQHAENQFCSRCSLTGGSIPHIMVVANEPVLLQPWREKRGEAEPKNHLVNLATTQPSEHESNKPSASSIRAAHTEFIAALAEHPPRPIPLDADAIDLEDRADHLSRLFSTLSVYLTVILDDTAQNVPGSLDLPDAEGILADLAADLTGPIQRAADRMAGWLA